MSGRGRMLSAACPGHGRVVACRCRRLVSGDAAVAEIGQRGAEIRTSHHKN
jgi:hypothetical protein